MSPWIYLAIAIVLELGGTICLKLSNGFSRLLFGNFVVVFYLGSFLFLGQALKTLEIGIVYAIWSGVGTALIATVGVFAFGESVTLIKVLGLSMIIGGAILLRLASTQA
jgi:small multidrug resistance pump